jgi:uncharacterized membrane protein HdeD (DUF308 family)
MSISEQSGSASIQAAIRGAVREHYKLFLTEGIVLLMLGALAIVLPMFATIAVTILIGWLFLISGVMGLIATFGARGAPGFWWSLTSGALATVAGLVLLLQPISGAISLTLVMIAFFIVEGVVTIMYALEHRRELMGRWEWMLVSGVIDLILAAIILLGFPGTAAWALGLLLGVNMIFGGSAIIAMALHARSSS